MACDHQHPRWGWPARCTGCGHRVKVGCILPRQSRELPPWTWPLELINRYRARRAGKELRT